MKGRRFVLRMTDERAKEWNWMRWVELGQRKAVRGDGKGERSLDWKVRTSASWPSSLRLESSYVRDEQIVIETADSNPLGKPPVVRSEAVLRQVLLGSAPGIELAEAVEHLLADPIDEFLDADRLLSDART